MTVPRELLVALRGELRAATGHWAHGFTGAGEPLLKHDTRMPGGECVVCTLLGLVDSALHPAAEPEPDPGRVSAVVNVGARRRRGVDRPPGIPLGYRSGRP